MNSESVDESEELKQRLCCVATLSILEDRTNISPGFLRRLEPEEDELPGGEGLSDLHGDDIESEMRGLAPGSHSVTEFLAELKKKI